MPRPLVAALPAIAAILLLPMVACSSDDAPASVTSTGSPPSAPAVSFTTTSGEAISLSVEVADTPEKRSQGLMGRETLPEDAGMLFTWPDDTESGFWMKDTVIPLSIAFIDAEGKIINIQDMQPLDETLHHSPEPYRYALEAAQGWFAENGIAVGDAVRLPESVSTPGG